MVDHTAILLENNTINEKSIPTVELTLIVGIGLALQFFLPFKIPFLAYSLILVIVILFLSHPYHAMLLSFLVKPIIDMSWLTKAEGFISPGILSMLYSPLFIAGILVPALAFINRKSITGRLIRSQYDWIVLVYLLLFGLLTLLKIIVILPVHKAMQGSSRSSALKLLRPTSSPPFSR